MSFGRSTAAWRAASPCSSPSRLFAQRGMHRTRGPVVRLRWPGHRSRSEHRGGGKPRNVCLFDPRRGGTWSISGFHGPARNVHAFRDPLSGGSLRLNIALATIGSSGDLMPFRWLARALTESGSSVRVLSHPDHAPYFEADPVAFVPIGPVL